MLQFVVNYLVVVIYLFSYIQSRIYFMFLNSKEERKLNLDAIIYIIECLQTSSGLMKQK